MRSMLALVVAGLAFAAAPCSSADLPQLIGTVGPGFTINLTDANGKHVDAVTAGRYELLVHDLSPGYELLVHDLSPEHNFALGSKTANSRLAQTEIDFVGDETFTLD